MPTTRSIRASFSRIEHAAAAICAEADTIEAWTARFLAASPRHREVVHQITERARVHTPGLIDQGRMHVGHAFISMLHQLPALLEPCEFRQWPTVADAEVAMPIMQRFMRQLVEYQRQTGDLCRPHWGIRELVRRSAPSVTVSSVETAKPTFEVYP